MGSHGEVERIEVEVYRVTKHMGLMKQSALFAAYCVSQ